MINGAHVILYSKSADADRAFFKDVLGLSHVDVGGGWLILGLPPAEVAVHPSERHAHELYLMCDDVAAFVASMGTHGIVCSPISNQGWGLLTTLTLPGGGELGVYQPRHARPPAPNTAPKAAKKPAARKAAPKKKRPAPRKKTAKPALKKRR
jgi:hypothetical protein